MFYNSFAETATLSILDDKYIQISHNKRTYIRTYWNTKFGLRFKFQAQTVTIFDPENIPVTTADVVLVDDSTTKVTVITDDQRSPATSTKHPQTDLIKTCIQGDMPVYLYGDAGTGKNYTLQQIAEELSLDFYFTNSVQHEYKLTGFIDAGGTYHDTEFYRAFTEGGLFFLDEMDASIPEVLVLLNAAIANRYFEFPTGKVSAHPDFRVVAAGNTVGSGADELYSGRLVLDAATLDRFVIIHFDYCRDIELSLCNNDADLVDFIRQARENAKKGGIRATFSYRAIITAYKLIGAGVALTTIMEVVIFKGLNKDTIRSFRLQGESQYHRAYSLFAA